MLRHSGLVTYANWIKSLLEELLRPYLAKSNETEKIFKQIFKEIYHVWLEFSSLTDRRK